MRKITWLGAYYAGKPGPPARSSKHVPLVFAASNDLPNVLPPFNPRTMIGDLDGRVWIQSTEPDSAGTVYVIADPRSDHVERVVLPRGRVVVGFGAKGAVYMMVPDGTHFRIERARIGGLGAIPQ